MIAVIILNYEKCYLPELAGGGRTKKIQARLSFKKPNLIMLLL